VAIGERSFLDHQAGPDGIEPLGFGHGAVAPLDQRHEQIERAAAQRRRDAVDQDLAFAKPHLLATTVSTGGIAGFTTFKGRGPYFRPGGQSMLFNPARHEPLIDAAWDERRVRATIERIVRDTEAAFSQGAWPLHPNDADSGETQPQHSLYFGAAGVVWALHYLARVGAARLTRSYAASLDVILERNRARLAASDMTSTASYLCGDTSILMLEYGFDQRPSIAQRLHGLIAGNVEHPARELMWGAPGTMLAALFMHELTAEAQWAELFRASARALWSQLEWSAEYECSCWTQDLYGQRTKYLDAVHGFVATALPLLRGRPLLGDGEASAWQSCIANTVRRTATRQGGQVNWRPLLDRPPGKAGMLMQYCHGAPGFVVCLGAFPGAELDDLLLAAGQAIWVAGPLAKGSNLCHGTGGNGYALLKLYERTQDPQWLDRARRFGMHGIAQTEAAARHYGRMRHSLWTGDPGFAIYLWDCIRGKAAFPTLDVFFDA
jgi:hypothetical protein